MDYRDRPIDPFALPPSAEPAQVRPFARGDDTMELPVVQADPVPGLVPEPAVKHVQKGGLPVRVLAVLGVVVLAAVATAVVMSGGGDSGLTPAATVTSAAPSHAPVANPSVSEEPSSPAPPTSTEPESVSGSQAPGGNESTQEQPGSGDSADEPTGTVATRPTLFGAWWAGDGKYAAKWEKPDDDGGLTVTGYVVKDCEGNQLASLGAGSFTVEVWVDSLDCMTVQAVNSAGAGQIARFWIDG